MYSFLLNDGYMMWHSRQPVIINMQTKSKAQLMDQISFKEHDKGDIVKDLVEIAIKSQLDG